MVNSAHCSCLATLLATVTLHNKRTCQGAAFMRGRALLHLNCLGNAERCCSMLPGRSKLFCICIVQRQLAQAPEVRFIEVALG